MLFVVFGTCMSPSFGVYQKKNMKKEWLHPFLKKLDLPVFLSPELLALCVVVDLTEPGAVLLVAAAVAVLQPRRLPVVRVFPCDVAPVDAAVTLHVARARACARVAVGALLSTSAEGGGGDINCNVYLHFILEKLED